MQDGSFIDSEEEREPQINLDDDQSEEEDIIQTVSPNSAIRDAIKNMKKELSANHISGKDSNINEKINKFPIIPLDKLSAFLLKFVKKANLSLYNRRILFAAITPIHHIYIQVINSKQYKNSTSQVIRSTLLSPPYGPNSLKKCFDYFVKVFNLIQYDLQQINETFFIQQFQSVIDKLQSSGQEDFMQIENDIDKNIQSIAHNFEKLHEIESINKLSYKQILRFKVDLKRFKLMILPFLSEDDSQSTLQNDFLSYYKNFYGEIKNFELFYKVNWIITQFKNNWDEPLFWFLPCQMANVDSDVVFKSSMEYLQTFWTTCDLTIISDSTMTKPEPIESETADQNEEDKNEEDKNDEKNDDENKNENKNEEDKNDDENGSNETESTFDPEGVRIHMFHLLDLLSFQNKLEPQNTSVVARSFLGTVNKYNSYFNLSSTLSPTNFDIEDIKTIISIVSALPYTMKDVACDLNKFLNERLKLLKQYMYIYNSEENGRLKINRKNHRCNFSSLISHSSISSTSSTSRFAQQILCNATYNEIFSYVHSFVIFASNAKENTLLYPMIKNEIHKLLAFYSELLLKTQMTNDSRTLANEAIQKAKEFELANSNSLQSCKEFLDTKKDEDEITVDLFHALKELTISTRRVLATNFIKDEKRDFMERFYTFLKICCSYFNNLKQQQIQSEHRINIESMKELLSKAFPLFDTQEIFRFETQNLEMPQISYNQENQVKEIDESELNSDDLCNEVDLDSVWTKETKDLLFNKSFPSIREQVRNLQIGISDDWRSVFEFKMLYKTFCRLFIVTKHQHPINENPTEYERDLHKFFSVATQFVMDENFNIRETIILFSTNIDSCRSLSIKWMFSNRNSKKDQSENDEKDPDESEDKTEVNENDKQHWDFLSLLFSIAFISVPHPIQTISIFLTMMTSREKVMETEGQQLNGFKTQFYSFLESFNNETADSFVKSSFVQNCLSVFENDLDFFFVDSENSDNKIQKQNIRQIIGEINKLKEKYTELSSIMTMMNTKYFDKSDSYSRLFVEIEFFANILKSFKDTLEILKKFDLLSTPPFDYDLGTNYISILNSTWPFSPGFLDLDMYKNDIPGFLLSLHSSISRLSSLRPNYLTIRRTFDFYMNLALSSFSFCFSSLNQVPQICQKTEQQQQEGESESIGRFSWNRNNYKDSSKQKRSFFDKSKDDDDEEDEDFNSFFVNKSKKVDPSKNQQQCIDEIRVNFHALAVLYSQCNENPTVILCCEVLARSTTLIKLLDEAGLSDFHFIGTILSGLSEASFAIINALNIKKEVDKILNSMTYFASLFGIKLSKMQKNPSSTTPPTSQTTTSTNPLSPTTKKETTNQVSQTTPLASPILNSRQNPGTPLPSPIFSSSSSKKKKIHQSTDDKSTSSSHLHHAKSKRNHGHIEGRKRQISDEDEDDEDLESTIPCLSDFPSLFASFKSAIPLFDRMSETIPQDQQEASHFYRARSLFNTIRESLDQIKVPTNSEQFTELVTESNQKMEMIQHHVRSHLKRIHLKIDSVEQKFKKMQSLIESDYSCITQKIEDETIKGEQLDEDITNARAELKRRSRNKANIQSTKIQKKKKRNESLMISSSSKDVLNFNFNFDSSSSSSSSKNNKPIARAQLIMAQAQELQRQNNLIQIQLQKNELENSILNSLNKNEEINGFIENQSSINEAVQNILKNASDVLVPESQQRKPLFDLDEDEKPSNVLSKSSIYSIMTEIIKWDNQHQNVTTIDHKDLCDKVELLAYSLISGTKNKENEMVKLQNQLKNVKSAQKDKLLKLRNILHEIDLDEE